MEGKIPKADSIHIMTVHVCHSWRVSLILAEVERAICEFECHKNHCAGEGCSGNECRSALH